MLLLTQHTRFSWVLQNATNLLTAGPLLIFAYERHSCGVTLTYSACSNNASCSAISDGSILVRSFVGSLVFLFFPGAFCAEMSDGTVNVYDGRSVMYYDD